MISPYRRSAAIYDALFRDKDYRKSSRRLVQVLRAVTPDARTLLDVGCGTGRHLAHLRGRFDVEGLDLSRQMLEIAGRRCPGVRFHQGSLVDFNLRRRFDVITCLFGAIAYAKTFATLRKATRCLVRHLHPGGVLIVEPWLSPDRFVAGRLVFDRVDGNDLKAARMYITRRRRDVSVFDSHYLVGSSAGVAHFTERQELGLYTDRQYRSAFQDAGLNVVARGPQLFGYGLYVCRLPAGITGRDSARR